VGGGVLAQAVINTAAAKMVAKLLTRLFRREVKFTRLEVCMVFSSSE
jgi:hypothetical protein